MSEVIDYRVFKKRVDLIEGESVELPEECIPLNAEPNRVGTEVTLWFLQPPWVDYDYE